MEYRLATTSWGKEEIEAIHKVIESDMYSMGTQVESFERELGESITIEQDPERIRKTDRMHLLADVSKLKSAIGWEPEWGIDQGVKTLINK